MEHVLGLYRICRSERRPIGYAAALIIVAAATGLRFAMQADAPPNLRFVLYYPAILIAGALFGIGPGLLALALSVAAIWFFFIGSPAAFEALSGAEETAMVMFVAANLLHLLITGLLRAATDESRAAMERTSDAERRLTMALAAGRMGTVSCDCRTLVGRWSATAAQIFGHPAVERAATVADWRALIVPEDWPRAEAVLFRGIAAANQFYAGEFRVRRPDGTVRTVDFSGSVIADDRGLALGMEGVVVDVTDRVEQRRRIEELADDLARSEERLRIAANSAQIGTWDWNPVEGTRTWSDEFRAILGARPDQPADPVWFGEHIHPADRERVIADHTAAMAVDGPGRHDNAFRIVRADDGAIRHVVVRGRVIRDTEGRVVRAIGTMIDATEIKSAELAIARSRDRVAVATAAAGLGVFEYSTRHPDGVWENDRLYEIFGRDPARGPIPLEEILREVVIAEDRAAFEAMAAEAARSDEFRFQFRFRHPSEGVRRVEVVGRGSHDADGLRIVVGTVKDITERHNAEERQHVLINELNHRVKNVLATVQAIAVATMRGNPVLPDFQGRLGSLAVANDILTRENWERADIRSLAEEVLAPYRRPDGSGTMIEGPAVTLGARGALAIAMTLHELATNAAKYGALSVPEGRVVVLWTLTPDGGHHRLLITWRESGGPPVSVPTRRGFGSRLMERMLAQEMGGSIEIEYAPTGLHATIVLALGTTPADAARRDGNAVDAPPEPQTPPLRAAVPSLKLVSSNTPGA